MSAHIPDPPDSPFHPRDARVGAAWQDGWEAGWAACTTAAAASLPDQTIGVIGGLTLSFADGVFSITGQFPATTLDNYGITSHSTLAHTVVAAGAHLPVLRSEHPRITDRSDDDHVDITTPNITSASGMWGAVARLVSIDVLVAEASRIRERIG